MYSINQYDLDFMHLSIRNIGIQIVVLILTNYVMLSWINILKIQTSIKLVLQKSFSVQARYIIKIKKKKSSFSH